MKGKVNRMFKIEKSDYVKRVQNLKEWMQNESIDALFVYGDEYRRENLRYVSNVWPIFERGAALIPMKGEPIILGAPEGELLCREMSAWKDIRLLPDFTCVTVPDEIDYPFANYTTFKQVFDEVADRSKLEKVAISGIEDMSVMLYETIIKSVQGAEIIDGNPIMAKLRLSKSDGEIKCLEIAASIADSAYKTMILAAIPGVTELELSGLATGEAMKRGAEYVPFCLVTSGDRVNTIIGRATSKIITEGEMVMAALAVQYEGYVASFGFPFIVGQANEGQFKLIDNLIGSYEEALKNLRAGTPQHVLVKAVKNYFAEKNLSQYDLYPPLHGCGLSEAESPYPNENTMASFVENMTVNTDISLFGHPDGSNRIETSLVVTSDGYRPLSQLVIELIESWKTKRGLLI